MLSMRHLDIQPRYKFETPKPCTFDTNANSRFDLWPHVDFDPKVTGCCRSYSTKIFGHTTKLQSLRLIALILLTLLHSQALTFDLCVDLDPKVRRCCWSHSTKIFRHTTTSQSLRLIGLILLKLSLSQGLTFDPMLTLTQRSPDAVDWTCRYLDI